MSILKELIAARKLIDAPSKWSRDGKTLDDGGETCALLSRHAVVFGANGALLRAGSHEAHYAFRKANGIKVVCDFNQSHSHRQVMAAFDAAIAEQRGRGP